jgi:hypothetical protein
MPRITTASAWLFSAALLAFFVVALAATRHVSEAAASPLTPPGHWRAALLVGLIGAFAVYAAAALLSIRRPFPRRLVTGIGCLTQLLPLATPLLLSTDAYTYWDYGRLAARHGANPYSTVPAAYPTDPAYHVMGSTWHHSATIYGPLFTWVSQLVAHVASSPDAAQLAFRLIAAGAMVAIVLTLSSSGASSTAIIVVGWSPLFGLHFAGGGHNDALMMALAVAAIAMGEKMPWISALLWIGAVAVKWIALVFLLLDLFLSPRRERKASVGRLAVAASIGILLSGAEYGTAWLRAVRGLSAQSRRTGSLGAAKWLQDLGLHHREVVALLALATLMLLGSLAYLALRGRRHLSVAGTGIAALQGWLNPWYAVWGAAVEEYDRARVVSVLASLALSALVLRDALPT